MAARKRPDADRLPISQRIDNRMDNPKRRRLTPTDWAIKGELFLNCSCTVFCPCVVSLGKHPPTEGHCHDRMLFVRAFHQFDFAIDLAPDIDRATIAHTHDFYLF